jgi:hypothetical protein
MLMIIQLVSARQYGTKISQTMPSAIAEFGAGW